MNFISKSGRSSRATSNGYVFDAEYGLPVDFGENEMIVTGKISVEFPRKIDLVKTKRAAKDLINAMEQEQRDTIADTIDNVPEDCDYSCVYEIEIDKDTELAKQLESQIGDLPGVQKYDWEIEHKKSSTIFSRIQPKE